MKMPDSIVPMRASAGKEAFTKPGWCFEIKLDGYRMLAYIDEGNVKLKTRNLVDYTDRYPPIVSELKKWKRNAILDGEIVVFNNNDISDLSELQDWRIGGDKPIYYFVFDLLWLDDKDYMKEPLYRRKSTLKHILPKSSSVIYHDEIVTFGVPAFKMSEREGLEGVVAKKVDSIYRPGTRSKEWLKLKVMKNREFIICGFTKSETIGAFSTLILGAFQKDKLQFAGEVGTGFSDDEQQTIIHKIKPTKKCPFVKEPVFRGRWGGKALTMIVWCRPEVVCSVRYLERTAAGELRHASFKGLRVDKEAKDVIIH